MPIDQMGGIQINAPNLVDISPFNTPDDYNNYIQRLTSLSEKIDQDVIVEGMKMIRDIFNQPSFKNLWNEEMLPGSDVKTDKEILAWAQSNGGTVFHAVGTCRMGSDNRSVVNEKLQVRGVENLRVIDASVMPQVTSANTNAPSLMIGEKGVSFLVES